MGKAVAKSKPQAWRKLDASAVEVRGIDVVSDFGSFERKGASFCLSVYSRAAG
jgi:hypothetical protein